MSNIYYPKYTEEQLQAFDNLPSGVLILAMDETLSMKYKYCNAYFANYLDYTHEEFISLLTENCFAAIYEADLEKARVSRSAVMEGKIVDSISRQKKKDGSCVWVHAHLRQIIINGKPGILFLFSKIQELIGLQDELDKKSKDWSELVNSVPIGMLVLKKERETTSVLSINQPLVAVANSVGAQLDSKHRNWTEAEITMILNQDIFAFAENEDIPLVKGLMENSVSEPISSCIFRLRGSNMGNTVYIYATCSSKETGKDCRTYYVTYQNVTEAENRRLELFEKQNQLYNLSYHDALTGCKNRNAYNEFTEACHTKRIYNVGLAFCDINGLKQTNDTLGHLYGDQMILHFASILKEYFQTESIYRISGDEFVIICPDTERTLFQKNMELLIKQAQAADNIASIGYIWKESVSDIHRRTQQAEQIMYVEKQRYYETTRTISSKHRSAFLETLLNDFENNRFVMFLQPKTSMDDSKVIGAEALVRKIGPDGNLILPYEFVPQLEHEMLIPKLDFYMLEKACAFLQEQHFAGNDDFSVSVNISRVTIVENEFLDTVEDIMSKYVFDRKNLELELTESNQTLDSIRLEEYLIQLKALGLKLSLDDMGTDYCTLSLLILEGIDWVKLDRSLVSRLKQEKNRTLLKHIINMCHELRLHVIAEGVETHEDRLDLLEMGCDAYQGYLKSKPIPVTEFMEKFL